MQEILLIRGGEAEQTLDALAAAAELTSALGDDAQVDIAVPADCADIAALSRACRRVVAIVPPETGDWSDITAALSEGAADGGGGGWGGKLMSAAKKISSVAKQNISTYWSTAQELRLTQYDVAFDFDSSAFSIAVGKMAKAAKIVAFDPKTLKNPMPAAALMAHEVYTITGEMSASARLRHLPARFFDYSPAAAAQTLDWQLNTGSVPPQTPPPPYIVVSGSLPPPFQEIAGKQPLPLVTPDANLAPADLAALVQGAAAVAGSGLASALAAAFGARNLYIGNQQSAPHQAIWISTPSEFSDALASSPDLNADMPAPAAPSAPAESGAAAASPAGGAENAESAESASGDAGGGAETPPAPPPPPPEAAGKLKFKR